jgi:hypothetical protein
MKPKYFKLIRIVLAISLVAFSVHSYVQGDASEGTQYAMAGVYAEVWTGELVKKMRSSDESIGWVNRIRSYDQYAENDVIHLVDVGVDPEVLINNTTYPIPIVDLSEADIAISLDKYQTVATRVTDDELYSISYDKMGVAVELHQEAIAETKYKKFLHALAPAGDTAKTPVIVTNGATSEDGLRKKITRKNIIALKNKFDKIKIPVSGRILVLCSDHVNDLLEEDQKFAQQYYNYTSGKISNLYGFELYEYEDCPYFTPKTKVKLPFAAVPEATDLMASVAFYAPRMMKATGSTKFYHAEAKENPTMQESIINYRHYAICLPKKQEAIGAIVSAAVSIE